MKVEILQSSFDPWRYLSEYQQGCGLEGKYGATSVFVGSMRDFNQGDRVSSMSLEHYPGMTEQYLEKLCQQVEQRWELLDTLVVHRVGSLQPADPVVLVAVWSAHRKAAFEACRYLMEELKSNAPLWKKEQLADAERWVENNTPG